jgi:CheY-like chemotaxis protein
MSSGPTPGSSNEGRERSALAGREILVVDDDPAVRGLMRRVLAARGFTVHEVGDGRQALAEVRSRAFHLMVTDLVMPEIEGLEVIRAIHRESPGLAILAVSGAYDGAFLHAARLLGAGAVLKKPFDPKAFVHAVEQLLEAASH